MVTKAFTFPRSHFIGFDHVWNEIERLSEMSDNKLYPPHNVVRHDEITYSIELALSGYKSSELSIEVKDGILVVQGVKGDEEREFLHKGISTKKFTRTFRLSEHVVVDGANFIDGLLVIDLKVVLPEEKRPRFIPIGKQLDLNFEGER